MAAGIGMETYAARLASFSVAHPVKKRGSDTKGTKTSKWPLKSPSADELATAGLFYQPTASSPDNAACFLCGKNLDGWEEDDNAVMEHLKLSPECGWAVNVYIEQQLGNGSYEIENPLDEKLVDARKMTFGTKWPHENKRGWICKTQKMIESGWYYCPTAESDDYAKCSYCSLGLDGWEPKDNPHDEHRRRSPECIFFTFSASMKPKRGRPRQSRTSKASRMSTQSNLTTASEVTSVEEPEAHETESIILAAPAEVERPIKAARGAKKGGKTKKAPAKSKAKAAATKGEDSTLASSFIEPEDDNFEVKVEKIPTKRGRIKKRGSDEMNGDNGIPLPVSDMAEDTEGQPPPAKRRTTRARSSVMQVNCEPASFLLNGHEVDASMTDAETMPPPPAPASKKGVKKGRKKPSSTVRTASGASIASVASLRSAVPDDDEIDAALEAELYRPLTDDEVDIEQPEIQQPKTRRLTRTRPASRNGTASTAQVRRTTRMSAITDRGMNPGYQDMLTQDFVGELTEKASHGLNGGVNDELNVLVPTEEVPKGNKSRKASSKQQTSATQSANEKANASVAALRVQPDLAPPKPKGPRSRQPSRQLPGRNTRQVVLPTPEDVAIPDSMMHSAVNVHANEDESGHETDASASSQAPKKRGGKKGFTGMKKKAGKKTKLISYTIDQLGVEDNTPNQKENNPNGCAMDVTKSPENKHLQVRSAKKALDSEKGEASVATSNGAQPVVAASPPASEERDIDDAIRVRSPSQSVSLTENGQGLQGSSKGTESMHESTPPLAETPQEAPKHLPPVQTTPRQVFSPQSSDAENQPPSSRPSATRPPLSVKSTLNTQVVHIRSPARTPTASPSKQNTSRLQSAIPWTSVEVEKLFLESPTGNEENDTFTAGTLIAQSVNESLTSPEKKLSMEEWIHHKARQAEEKLRNDCERLVGRFEGEGVRALRTLEGISCID